MRTALWGIVSAFLCAACDLSGTSPGGGPGTCAIAPDSAPDFASSLGCRGDFQALSAHRANASIPQAYAVETLIDRADGNRLYFLNGRKYSIHYEFASTHLSGDGKPAVGSMSEFGRTEYYTPDRRFILGTLVRYEGAGIWSWEITASDNAGAELIELAYRKVAGACFCGKELYFHATSLAIEAEARKLPATVKVLATAGIRDGVACQPLGNATGIGRLVFASTREAGKGRPDSLDILVLDSVPDRLPVAAGLITDGFQAPLGPVNVLARERGIPNLGLRGAFADPALRALEGEWAKLTVDPFGYSVAGATQAEAEAWRDAHKPAAVPVPEMDTTEKELRDAEGILEPDSAAGLGEALKKAIAAYGGPAAHFAAFARMDSANVKYGKAFGIPVFHYRRHMRQNGLDDSVAAMLADPAFMADPAVRERRLESLREAIRAAPLDPGLGEMLGGKLERTFPGAGSFRFIPSPNAGGLDGFSGAGLYGSRIGGPAGSRESIREALLGVWAGAWDFGAFEERRIRNIDHKAMGVAVLVRESGGGEEASGSAVTANPLDPFAHEPGFYVNVAPGGAAVPNAAASGALDQFIYHYTIVGQPIVMIARADRSPAGRAVLTPRQIHALGNALWEIHNFFQPLYGGNPATWYAMGTTFKLARKEGDPPGAEPGIIMESAGVYRGWGRW